MPLLSGNWGMGRSKNGTMKPKHSLKVLVVRFYMYIRAELNHGTYHRQQ